MKDPKKVKTGRQKRIQGKAFESRVRKDLESKGWIVDKWTNQVEFEFIEKIPYVKELHGSCKYEVIKNKNGKITRRVYAGWSKSTKLVPAKAKFNPFTKTMMMNSGGFPDFIAIRHSLINQRLGYQYEVVGVESKMDGKLDKEEKEKCDWLLENNIFSKILIASKTKVKNKIVVEYEEYTTN